MEAAVNLRQRFFASSSTEKIMTGSLLTGLIVLSVLTGLALAEEAGPNGWRFMKIRDETAARSSVTPDGGMAIHGNGSVICDGRWVHRTSIPSGQFVRLTARYRASNIEMTARNVIAALVWLDDHGQEIGNADFAATTAPADAGGWRPIDAVFPVPAKAKQVQIELALRWSADGEVEWRDAKLESAPSPAPRKVKIASINHRPRHTKSIQENLDQFSKLIDEAGANHADVVCLPEGITVIGRGSNYLGAAEPIPGPSTEFLGKCAAKNKTYIVAGLYERDGKGAYNTAVLIGRDGKLVGKYRKICLPRGESDGGLAPGCEYPVFDTDFGKVGMMICWDVSYPEVARELAARGAEMILMPIWGGNETLCRARAIENQIPLVISSYDLRSAIYDQAGEPKAIAKDTSSCVVYAEMDLAQAMDWKWTGHWRDRIWLEGPVRKEHDESVARAKADR
jgi:predicted amidohydrolase